MVYLRTLRNSELMYIFKTLTYGNSLNYENLLTCDNLLNLFNNIYNINYTHEEINFTINYLKELSNSHVTPVTVTGPTATTNNFTTSNIGTKGKGANSMGMKCTSGPSTVTEGLDFITFSNSINNILKINSLEILLKNIFDNISNNKNYITIDDIINFTLKCNIKLSEDSKLKLTSRFSTNINFNQFIQIIINT
ncbi:uncharacterized protein TA20255 [Theileria annulata]|uniref:Uncharacterized protein n=1 Tax=Theileria annulata TaxID=5874 RepID=Q4UHA6_THEAN|nr:uncharacterized protein TA20255 [Theileria annulata]CAI73533.1 hypothetical protein TA20255 [Theileria annulata]|eukprot:XP_954210.1 hypothetical protein TA20255 [Theileria annulata]